jgi:hypothetical protein
MTETNDRLIKKTGLIEHEVEDELAIYDPDADRVHILNSTASVVWWLLDDEHSAGRIISSIARLYGLERVKAKDDVNKILCEFTRTGLLLGK